MTRCTRARVGQAFASPLSDLRWSWACACGATGTAERLAEANDSIKTHDELGRINQWTTPEGHHGQC